jgi:hypothetical protein
MRKFAKYFFVGSYSEVDGREFTQVGQYAEWTEETYKEKVLGNCPFIPHKEFVSCGFTTHELLEYGSYVNLPLAPDSFRAKHVKARRILHDIRERLKSRPHEQLPEEAPEVRQTTEEV